MTTLRSLPKYSDTPQAPPFFFRILFRIKYVEFRKWLTPRGARRRSIPLQLLKGDSANGSGSPRKPSALCKSESVAHRATADATGATLATS